MASSAATTGAAATALANKMPAKGVSRSEMRRRGSIVAMAAAMLLRHSLRNVPLHPRQ